MIDFSPDNEETLSADDGTPLHYYEWRAQSHGEPPMSPRGGVVLVHGLAEHLLRYRHLVNALTNRGWMVGGCDHRGMGRSGGVRGFVPGFDAYVNDVSISLRRLRSALPAGAPVFVYGHSMGGLVALLHAEHREDDAPSGTILSGPLLEIALKVPDWQILFGKLVRGIAPRFQMPVQIVPELLTHDPEDIARLRADTQLQKYVTVAWFFASMQAMKDAAEDIGRLHWPTLWLLPGEDRICSAAASRSLFRQLSEQSRRDKHTLLEYPGLYHELHNESASDREKVLGDVLRWMDLQSAQLVESGPPIPADGGG